MRLRSVGGYLVILLLGFLVSSCEEESTNVFRRSMLVLFHNDVIRPATERLDPYTEGAIPDSVAFIRITYSTDKYFDEISIFELSYTGDRLVLTHMMYDEKDSAAVDVKTMNMMYADSAHLEDIRQFLGAHKTDLMTLNTECEVCKNVADGRIAYIEYRIDGKYGLAFDASFNELPSKGIPASTIEFHKIEQGLLKVFEPVSYIHWMSFGNE